MRNTLVQRVLLALLPALLLVSIGASAIWGDSGLLARYRLERELRGAGAELASLDRENQHLVRELTVMSEDPVVLERIVAEELGWGREGTVIVRFPAEGAAAVDTRAARALPPEVTEQVDEAAPALPN